MRKRASKGLRLFVVRSLLKCGSGTFSNSLLPWNCSFVSSIYHLQIVRVFVSWYEQQKTWTCRALAPGAARVAAWPARRLVHQNEQQQRPEAEPSNINCFIAVPAGCAKRNLEHPIVSVEPGICKRRRLISRVEHDALWREFSRSSAAIRQEPPRFVGLAVVGIVRCRVRQKVSDACRWIA